MKREIHYKNYAFEMFIGRLSNFLARTLSYQIIMIMCIVRNSLSYSIGISDPAPIAIKVVIVY